MSFRIKTHPVEDVQGVLYLFHHLYGHIESIVATHWLFSTQWWLTMQCNPPPLSLLWLQLLENWQTNVQLLMNCQTWFYWISTPTNNFASKKQTINQTKFGLDEFVSSIYLDGWNTNNYIINWNFCANIFAHLRCIVLRLCTILLPKNLY